MGKWLQRGINKKIQHVRKIIITYMCSIGSKKRKIFVYWKFANDL